MDFGCSQKKKEVERWVRPWVGSRYAKVRRERKKEEKDVQGSGLWGCRPRKEEKRRIKEGLWPRYIFVVKLWSNLEIGLG